MQMEKTKQLDTTHRTIIISELNARETQSISKHRIERKREGNHRKGLRSEHQRQYVAGFQLPAFFVGLRSNVCSNLFFAFTTSDLLSDYTQSRMVVSYRYFGTTYRSNLHLLRLK